jgi:uncharacterized membrane protein YdjX (TVP38/TMEM64 family)
MNAVLAVLQGFAAVHPIGAVVSFVLLRSLCVAYPPAPGLPMDLAAIGLFGPLKGFEFAEVGIMLGATVAFVVGRHARYSRVSSTTRTRLSVLASRVTRSIDPADERQQFSWWFVARLLTNPLFDPLSYAAGLGSSQFRPFFFGTLFGNVPSMGLFFLAESYAIGAGPVALAAVTAMFGLTIWGVASRWLIQPRSDEGAR